MESPEVHSPTPDPNEMMKAVYGSLHEAWIRDVPFILVPPEIVGAFRGHRFTPLEFYTSEMWKLPDQWNSGYIFNGQMVIFMYGHFHKLEKYLYVERIGAAPSFQRYGLKVWELMIEEAKKITKAKGFDYLWTTGWRKGEIRKFLAAGGGKLNTFRYILDTKL